MLHECEEMMLEIYDKYSNMIYKICLVYLKNQHDAEDALQEIFIKISDKAPIFQSENHEKAWIIRVTCNYCKNLIRYNTFKKYVLYDDNSLVSETYNYDNTLQYILKLPLQYRKVLYLYYYEGYSTKEIASILKRRDATIRTWLKRAREKLKNIIGGDYNEQNI